MHAAVDPPWPSPQPPSGALAAERPARQAWRALRLFNLYRLVIAGLLCVLAWQGQLFGELDTAHPLLARVTAGVYLGLGLLAQGLVERRRLRLGRLVFLLALLDILALSLMVHATGGVGGGLALLLLAALAGTCLLTGGETAALLAAIACVAILLQESLLQLSFKRPTPHYMQAGLLGVGLFATALLAHGLARRVRETEALATRRGIDLANLARLNAHIVGRMQSGILVVSADGAVRLANDAARALLALGDDYLDRPLGALAPELAALRADWLQRGVTPGAPLRVAHSDSEVTVGITPVGPDNSSDLILFLEDAGEVRQRAQSLKLASLARLTGSIAHEVRNPLGAIHHAAQLLGESAVLGAEDAKLTAIIREQATRVNRIVENVLSIGRRERPRAERFELVPWLSHYREEFCQRHQLPTEEFVVELAPELKERPLMVRMDASQLHQVLWNLTENALRHSRGTPRVRLRAGVVERLDRPCLDVIDTGTGVAPADRDALFEPFFTREVAGTGLGLYLARELCELNQASLTLHETGPEGSCFRIRFPHPERRRDGMDA
jgi:two-component system sensor histidine kinase PilS (NtrC family)